MIGVDQTICAVIFRNLHGGFHFFQCELCGMQGVKLAGYTTTCHDLYLCCPGSEVVSHRFGSFCRAINDIRPVGFL